MGKVIPGSHGGTYGGNIVSCAAGAATLDVIEEEHLLENASTLGKTLLAELKEIKKKHSCIGDVRGLGLMAGVEFIRPGGKTPDKEKALAVKEACIENGMLILTCGTYDNIIRFIPPLIITKKHLKQGMEIFNKALEQTS